MTQEEAIGEVVSIIVVRGEKGLEKAAERLRALIAAAKEEGAREERDRSQLLVDALEKIVGTYNEYAAKDWVDRKWLHAASEAASVATYALECYDTPGYVAKIAAAKEEGAREVHRTFDAILVRLPKPALDAFHQAATATLEAAKLENEALALGVKP